MKLGREQERHKISVGQIQNQEHPAITKKVSKKASLLA
jgi:hypothetical protein